MDFWSALMGAATFAVLQTTYRAMRRKGAISDYADHHIQHRLIWAIRRSDYERADISEALERARRWH